MNHEESCIKVHHTKDYKRFKVIKGNRALNKGKISRIIKEINAGNDILAHVPILVSEGSNCLEVIDGQHRFEISKQLGRPVHYIVRPKMTLLGIAKVNTNVEKWKAKDFINCYIATGNKNYEKIEEFMDSYQIPLSATLVLLNKGITTKDSGADVLRTQFEAGTFEVKCWKQAVDIAECCKRFSTHRGWNCRAFVVAICKILQADKCDIDELVEKFTEEPRKLEVHGDPKKYLANLEEIYNKGYRQRRVIF